VLFGNLLRLNPLFRHRGGRPSGRPFSVSKTIWSCKRRSRNAFPRGWCSAQRIYNQNDCRWQSYQSVLGGTAKAVTDEGWRAPKVWNRSETEWKSQPFRPHSSSVTNQRFVPASPRGKPLALPRQCFYRKNMFFDSLMGTMLRHRPHFLQFQFIPRP